MDTVVVCTVSEEPNCLTVVVCTVSKLCHNWLRPYLCASVHQCCQHPLKDLGTNKNLGAT